MRCRLRVAEDDSSLLSDIKADLANMEAQAVAQAARVSQPPQTNDVSQAAPAQGTDQQQTKNDAMISGQAGGLVPAPPSFGKNKFIVSNEDIRTIVARETQALNIKLQNKDLQLKTIKRYVDDLEEELDEAQEQLEDERSKRLAAEAELNRLQQKQTQLAAKETVAEAEVSRRDLYAEELAERFNRGEISEEEFVRAEEELIEAQNMHHRSTEQLQEVSAAVARAESVQNVALENERKVAEALDMLAENKRNLAQKQAELERVMAERDVQQKESEAELARVRAERDAQEHRADQNEQRLGDFVAKLKAKKLERAAK